MSKKETEATIVKIGKIELPVSTTPNQYVPQNSSGFIDHSNILEPLAIGIRDNLPVLLMGESGTGKTSAIRHLAQETKHGLRRINLNGGTTADELVGRLLINEKGTYWIDGILTEAMRNGEWVVLDEINAALPEVLFVLQSIMDDDGYLVLNEKDDKEIVRKHPDFRLFATCNPPEYAGTKEMNQALLSRFAICINAEFPPQAKELDIIENHLGNAIARSEFAIKLVGLAKETRNAKEVGKADYAINTRDILNALRLGEFMDPFDALAHAFANKLDKTDNKALMILAKTCLPETQKAAKAVRKELKSPEDLKIGNTYMIDADHNQAYLGLTEKDADLSTIEAKDISDIIIKDTKDNAIKNDQFQIEGFYYQDLEKGFSTVEDPNLGSKVGSVIKFVAGGNKGRRAVILHHEQVGDSLKIMKNLFEITSQ